MSRTKPELEAKHKDKQKDKDNASGLSCITDYKTDSNVHDIACRDCGKIFYTDEQTARSFERAVQHDLDNPFICYKCEQMDDAGTPFE